LLIWIKWQKNKVAKNKLFGENIELQKIEEVTVLLSITSSFYPLKQLTNFNFQSTSDF
jgi:hypothetical protein